MTPFAKEVPVVHGDKLTCEKSQWDILRTLTAIGVSGTSLIIRDGKTLRPANDKEVYWSPYYV